MSKPRTVRDLMQSPVATATQDEPLTQAARRMRDAGIGSLVVTDGHRMRGIVTERDVLAAAASGKVNGHALEADMTPEPITVTPDATPAYALDLMRLHGFRHLPVADSEGLLGMVSVRDLIAYARMDDDPSDEAVAVPKGLEGVVVAETAVGEVQGRRGFYHYRQYSAVELAQSRSLEDVWHLLAYGDLPATPAAARAFADRVARMRQVPETAAAALPAIAASGGTPLDNLRSALSVVGASQRLRPVVDLAIDEVREQTVTLTAVVPTLITTLYRLARGEQPIEPDPSLGYAANYLWMLNGHRADERTVRALEQYLISTIDHGFNASTFTARVITSTGADAAAALAGAVGALSGPLHGGAPSRALELLDEIRSVDRAEAVVRDKVVSGARVMGFGHRVYKTRDPRAVLLREVAERLGGDRAALAAQVEDVVVRVLDELKPGRELYANVEYYAGVVLEQVGIPPELFTATFAASRMIGWSTHVTEQASDNRIIRPTSRYVGPPAPAPLPHTD